MQVRVAIFGRNYHAADKLPGQLTLPDGASLDGALEKLAELMPNGQRLPESCLVGVSGAHLGTVGRHPARVLCDGDELTVVALVAGG